MHEYESAASGIGHPYVWDQVWGWMDTPLTFDQMRTRYSVVGFRICCCGPNTKPAEDVPEEDELDELPSYPRLASLPWVAETNAPAASDREQQPAAAVPVDSDWLHVVDDSPSPAATAKTAPATAPAAEAQPPETDEAPTMQPPEKRVSYEIPFREPPASVPMCRHPSIANLFPPVKAPPSRHPSRHTDP